MYNIKLDELPRHWCSGFIFMRDEWSCDTMNAVGYSTDGSPWLKIAA